MGMLLAVVHREGEWFVAQCPQIGTVSQGKTVEEALNNLREATELYLEVEPVPDVDGPVCATVFEASTP